MRLNRALPSIALGAALFFALPARAETGAAPADVEDPIVLEMPFFTGAALMLAAADIVEADMVEADMETDLGPYEAKRGRINVKRKNYGRTRGRLAERRFGFALQPGYAMLEGDVVKRSYGSGFAFTARFIAQVSPINQLYVDLGYSRHDMKNPRAMFFRTAVTDASGFSGTLQVINPAVYFAQTFPIGAGFHSRSLVIPKLYVGLGAMFTIADGTVTNSGIKGTVTGEGTQPFVQFTPGFATDVRILEDFFVGFDLRYRLTLPTTRPNQTKEFTIPRLYVFEPSLSFAWMFY